MSRTEYVDVGVGNSYALSIADNDPFNGSGAIVGVPVGTTGIHAFSGLEDGFYTVRVKSGASPDTGDNVVGQIEAAIVIPIGGPQDVFVSTSNLDTIDYAIAFNTFNKKIKLYKGDSYSNSLFRNLQITFNNLPIDLTGISVTFVATKKLLSITGVVTVTGTNSISVTFSDTETAKPFGKYPYCIKTNNGVTLLTGYLEIVDAV